METLRGRPQRKTIVSEWVGGVSREFNVSTVMATRQIWAHSAISSEDLFEFYDQERDKWTTVQKQSSSRGFTTSVKILLSMNLSSFAPYHEGCYIESIRTSSSS
ncbi:MAG: hypothetical protein OXI96_06545 [Acidimicrobiaceae bacterium]|nr:hypothetical protein [Acidimicrobiaceae bacterium]